MSGDRIDYYRSLIEEILQNNRDALDKDTLDMAMVRLAAAHPMLIWVSFDEELKMKADFEEDDQSLGAFRGLLESLYDFLTKLIGADMAEEKILRPLYEKFKRDRSQIQQLGLEKWFPQFLLEKAREETLAPLRAKDPMEQQMVVFKALFTAFMAEAARTEDASMYIKKVAFARSNQDHFTEMGFDGDLAFQLVPKDKDIQGQLQTLIDLFNSFESVSAFVRGDEAARRQLVKTASTVLAQFEEIPVKIGITDNILKGAIARRISTGMRGFDAMIEGGIPRGCSLMVKAPAGNEVELIFNQFLKRGLRDSGAGLVVLSTTPPDVFMDQMRKLGADTRKAMSSGLLKIVDWYSWKVERVNGVEVDDSGAIIRSSKMLSNLSIAIKKAISTLPDAPTKRAVVRFLTPSMKAFPRDEVYSAAQKMTARFKESDVTALFLIEKEAHDEGTIATYNDVFDGVLNLEKVREGDSMRSKICVESMAGTYFVTDFRDLEMKENTIDIRVGPKDPGRQERDRAQKAFERLKEARVRINSAYSQNLNVVKVEEDYLEAQSLYHKKDYEGAERIAEACINDVEEALSEQQRAEASVEDAKRIAEAGSMIERITKRMLRFKEEGADVSTVEDLLSEATVAIENNDISTAMNVVNRCETILEEFGIPPGDRGDDDRSVDFMDKAVVILNRVRNYLRMAEEDGVDIAKAEGTFRKAEKAFRDENYVRVLEISNQTMRVLSDLVLASKSEKMQDGEEEAQWEGSGEELQAYLTEGLTSEDLEHRVEVADMALLHLRSLPTELQDLVLAQADPQTPLSVRKGFVNSLGERFEDLPEEFRGAVIERFMRDDSDWIRARVVDSLNNSFGPGQVGLVKRALREMSEYMGPEVKESILYLLMEHLPALGDVGTKAVVKCIDPDDPAPLRLQTAMVLLRHRQKLNMDPMVMLKRLAKDRDNSVRSELLDILNDESELLYAEERDLLFELITQDPEPAVRARRR